MDSLLLRCASSDVRKLITPTHNRSNCWLVSSANGCYYSSSSASSSALLSSSSSSSASHKASLRTQVIVAATKRGNNNNNSRNSNKVDKHSFVPKPDEATGPFPEAVLLKQKKLKEDGKLLPDFADAEEQELFEALSLQLESDLSVERTRHYEVVYLIHEDREEEVESVNEKVQEFIKEKKGRLWRFSDWGMRRLAYQIQKAKNAHYILMNFEIEAKWINEFKTMLDKDERVIRHLVIKREKAEIEECLPPLEFHTLRAGMDDNDVEDFDYVEDYDDEDEGEDWEDEGAEADGIIYVEDAEDDDDRARGSKERTKQKIEVAR